MLIYMLSLNYLTKFSISIFSTSKVLLNNRLTFHGKLRRNNKARKPKFSSLRFVCIFVIQHEKKGRSSVINNSLSSLDVVFHCFFGTAPANHS